MMTESEIIDLFRTAANDLEPPSIERLVSTGMMRGRRMRQHRRARWLSEGLVAVGIVIVMVALAMPFLHAVWTPQLGAIEPGNPRTTIPNPAPTPVLAVPLTPQVVADTLRSLIPDPAGTLTHLSGRALAGFVNGDYIYDDGHGLSEILIGVGWKTGESKVDQPPNCPAPTSTCRHLPDGSQLDVEQGYEYPDRKNKGPLEWSVLVTRADGMSISLYERNANSKAGTISRPLPPFTIAELTTIVMSSAWKATTDSATASRVEALFTPEPPPTP